MIQRMILAFCIVGFASSAFAQTTRRALTRPTTGPEANPGASGLSVAIKSAKVDFLALRKPLPGGGYEDLGSNEKLLIITLEITNKGDKEIAYKSFNGAGGADDHAALRGDDKRFLPLAQFGELEPVDLCKQATLKPGDTITDVVCFAPPKEGVKSATLFLPARNHGDKGMWKLEVKWE